MQHFSLMSATVVDFSVKDTNVNFKAENSGAFHSEGSRGQADGHCDGH